ncbi:MAG: glycosyltransferase family 39 protein [Anaerolineales bacterium]
MRYADGLTALALLAICGCALALRLYGLDWDQGLFFHPDERQVFYVTEQLALPKPLTLSALRDPESTWNPHFFAYGSLPMYLLRLTADLGKLWRPELGHSYGFYLLGRGLSALFDLGSVLLTYALGRRLYGRAVGLVGSLFVALAVLHVQLSHFYTVDTLLAFFVLAVLAAAVRLAQRGGLWATLPLGLALGAALATKASSAPLAVIVLLGWVLATRRAERPLTRRRALAGCVLSAGIAGLTFLLCEPYAVFDYAEFVEGVARESLMVQGAVDWPYTRQYIGTLPYLYLFWQTCKWGLGLPLGLAGFVGAAWALGQQVRRLVATRLSDLRPDLLPVVWFVLYFGLVGAFHTKFVRYMLPVTPLLCLWAAWLCVRLWPSRLLERRSAAEQAHTGRRGGRLALAAAPLVLVLASTAFYAGAFTNVYRQEHPWIRATRWICDHYPPGSVVMAESWDDPLPLLQGHGDLACTTSLRFQFFEAHDEDSQQKLDALLDLLTSSDYVSLSSNRLYNALPRLDERFPLTTRYYQLLLGEQLGFTLVHVEETYPSLWGVTLADDTFSNPDLPVPALIANTPRQGLWLNLGRADESLTVYDHPKPLIFAKTQELSREQLLALFGDAALNLPDIPPEE